MELNKEFIESNNLSTEQVEALQGYMTTDVIPNIKKEYDGLANKNAEAILDGASRSVLDKFGITESRQQGEKIADFLTRIVEKPFEETKLSLDKKTKEIEDKLANFKGGDEYKSQLDKLNKEKDDLLKQVAELEPLKGLDLKIKEKDQELSGLKLNVAFNGIKPNFPETVNKYEAEAKWSEFKNGILEKFNIELVDGKPIAVDKENHHKQIKLSDLLEQDKSITDLLEGRQQAGTGGKPASLKDVEGIPFKVPQNATTEELSTIVREHLEKKLGSRLHPNFPKEFQEILMKIKKTA
jgi:hypothetical protein